METRPPYFCDKIAAMMSWVFILLLIPLNVVGQTAKKYSAGTEPPQHFYWSERNARELDYNHTLRNATDLTNEEKGAVFKFILREFKADPDRVSDDMTESEIQKLVWNTRIELADLKGDTTRDVIAQANGLPLCGGTGNCSIWVFEFRSGSMKVLLDDGWFGNGFEVITVRPWRVNGYNEIVLGSHVSASERELVSYEYNGGSYKASACFSLSWIGDNGQTLANPEISRIKCNDSAVPKDAIDDPMKSR